MLASDHHFNLKMLALDHMFNVKRVCQISMTNTTEAYSGGFYLHENFLLYSMSGCNCIVVAYTNFYKYESSLVIMEIVYHALLSG